jgi:transcriptional regulator with XRE-family HTH domain
LTVYRIADINIAMTIKEIREEKGITQIELAKLCGVQQATISDIERGKIKSPSVETAQRIARALGVTLENLFPVDSNTAA